MTLAYRIVRILVTNVAYLVARPEYIGLENIPDEPPYILVTNHLSAFDIPLLSSICPHHTIRAFAASEHKWNPLYAPILAAAGSIWVRRGEADRRALREALAVLERGEALGVAPEGTRARDPYALQKGKSGVAFLATRADVPIVPVGMAGTERIRHNLPRLRRTRVQVAVGEPFRLPESGHAGSRKLREYTDLIMYHIAELLPREYRGVYA